MLSVLVCASWGAGNGVPGGEKEGYHGMYAHPLFSLSLFSFHLPFLRSTTSKPLLTYAFRGIPAFHIRICSYLPFHTYIVLHDDTCLFPSFDILFHW